MFQDRTSQWGGVWFPVYNNVTCTVPISGPELTAMMILFADWRCWHYVIKRQNDTVEVNPSYIVPSLSLKVDYKLFKIKQEIRGMPCLACLPFLRK